MFQRPVKEINAEFSAEEKYLDAIQRTVRESCIAAGMSGRDTNGVLLATEEAATNIIRHAYLYERGTIRLRVVIYSKLVVFSLIDFGRSFQPDTEGTIDLQRLVASGRKGGLGFYMIQKIMDSVQYITSAGRNELRMIKRLGPDPAHGRPFLRRLFGLRVKFSLFTFLFVASILGGAFWYIDYRTAKQFERELDETVRSLAQTVADQAEGYTIRSRSDVEFDELVVSYKRANPELEVVVLTDSRGLVRAHSNDTRSIRKPYQPPAAVDTTLVDEVQRFERDGRQLRYLSVRVESGRSWLGRVNVIYSSETIKAPARQARLRVVFLTAVLLLFGVIGIYFLSNYFVEPIVKITQRVRRFTSGDLESELPLEGAEEFFEISRAFNEMMTRVSQDRMNIAAREKLAKEIEVASQIQKTLLPRTLPRLPGLDIDAFYRAAEVVGGDLYDVFAIDEHRYCLTVADVSGKGVPASLVMSMLRTVIQIFSAEAGSPRETLIKVDDYLSRNMPSGIFITLMLAVYDAAAGHLDLVSAGHNPMLLLKAGSSKVRTLNPSGMPLGVPDTLEQSFAEKLEHIRLMLEPGDLLLMYTDGITEATDRDGRQYGLDRLSQLLVRTASEGFSQASAVAESITADVDEFTGFRHQNDDITFIVAVRSGADRDAPSNSGPDSISLSD